jgi:hypothetical protein
MDYLFQTRSLGFKMMFIKEWEQTIDEGIAQEILRVQCPIHQSMQQVIECVRECRTLSPKSSQPIVTLNRKAKPSQKISSYNRTKGEPIPFKPINTCSQPKAHNYSLCLLPSLRIGVIDGFTRVQHYANFGLDTAQHRLEVQSYSV